MASSRLSHWNAHLLPCAVPYEGILGRPHPETEDPTRFPFQRDRDRIIHTQAFRRLQGKTQVFVSGEGDHFRTRLTHTMEVAQIARDMARFLGLNEDLAECIALAHDLGHPPFGHAGEEAIDAWMRTQGDVFEHNLQSYRIVTLLERHSDDAIGLNLHREVLNGLLKHSTPHDHPHAATAPTAVTLEAQLVDLADEIAYTGHDVDDGLRAGLFTREDLQAIPFAESALRASAQRKTSIRGALIHLLISDVYATVQPQLQRLPSSPIPTNVLALSAAMRSKQKILRAFLWERMYQHPRVRTKTQEGQRILHALCAYYAAHPDAKVRALQQETGSTLPVAVKDYVAGMTDAYARQQVSLLELSIPSR